MNPRIKAIYRLMLVVKEQRHYSENKEDNIARAKILAKTLTLKTDGKMDSQDAKELYDKLLGEPMKQIEIPTDTGSKEGGR